MSDNMQAAALDAVSSLVHGFDRGAIVTRFVLLAEVVDANSERAVWQFVASGATRWDTLGLLDHARAVEYGAVRDGDL